MEQEIEKKQRLDKLKEELNLLSIEDICYITGWTDKTLRRAMQYDTEFPVIKIGIKDFVEFDSLKKYLSTRKDLRGKFEEKRKLKFRKEI